MTGIGAAGDISVAVAKAGYAINPGSRTVSVHYVAPVTFNALTANGSAAAVTTTELALKFSADIAGLTAADIALTAGATGAVKGALAKTAGATGEYTLAVTGIGAGGSVSVAVAKAGYRISPGSRTVNVHYVAPVTFDALTANGGASATTTELALKFSADIAALTAADIALTAGATGAVKGDLVKTAGAAGEYTLAVTGVSAAGEIAVAVAKTGYAITPGSRTVTVSYYEQPVSFSSLTANGSVTATTTELALKFSADIPGLSAGDITITAGAKGALVRTGAGEYTLAVADIGAAGEIAVAVAKTGYSFTPNSKTVTVYALGTAAVNLVFADDGSLTDGDTSNLSIDRSEGQTLTVTAAAELTDIQWSLNGTAIPAPRGEAESILIEAANYPAGAYQLGLAAKKNGAAYSASITFTVLD